MRSRSPFGLSLRSTVVFSVLALVGCGIAMPPQAGGTDPQPAAPEPARNVIRRPALASLSLQEGLNLVDRDPSGLRLVARVEGGEIVEWQVSDQNGPVPVFQQSDDGMGFHEACDLSGGVPETAPNGALVCRWAGWGCLVCDDEGPDQECTMFCRTQRCRDANGELEVAPDDPDDPPLPGGLVALPGGEVVAVDPDTPGWTLTDAAGASMAIPARRKDGLCPICAPRESGIVCWELACLRR
jgi:hypothetical protein